MPEKVWFNGAAVAQVPASLRALHYGDGVFRTCLAWNGRVADLDAQVARLHRDAARLGLDPPPVPLLVGELETAAALDPSPAVLKSVLSRVAGDRGYRSAERAADRLLFRSPAPFFPERYWSQGIRVRMAELVLAAQPRLAGIKHLNRLEQVLASQSLDAEVDELLLAGPSGGPICGTRTNLFWVSGGRLHTPDLSRCGVEGVMRDRVRSAAAHLGIESAEVDAKPGALDNVAEIFVTNSLIGLWPVSMIGTRRLAAPGPISRRLQAVLAHPRLSST